MEKPGVPLKGYKGKCLFHMEANKARLPAPQKHAPASEVALEKGIYRRSHIFFDHRGSPCETLAGAFCFQMDIVDRNWHRGRYQVNWTWDKKPSKKDNRPNSILLAMMF